MQEQPVSKLSVDGAQTAGGQRTLQVELKMSKEKTCMIAWTCMKHSVGELLLFYFSLLLYFKLNKL